VPEVQQAEVLKVAQRKAGDAKMTSRHIKDAAQEINSKNSAQQVISAPAKQRTPQLNTATIIPLPEVCSNVKILPFVELSKIADTVHDIFPDPSRHEEAEALIFKLKENLRLYAEREAKNVSQTR